VPAIEKAVRDSLGAGALIGFPVLDVLVSLVDGSYHEEESSEQAFGVATAMAMRKGLAEAAPVLLEPVMELEVVLPEQFMGDVVGDLNGKRAKILGMESRERGMQIIKAHVPLAEMFGYSTDLRSVTQGRANYTMRFVAYDRVPDRKAKQIVQKVKGLL